MVGIGFCKNCSIRIFRDEKVKITNTNELICEYCLEECELIECFECGRESYIEKDTYAYDKGMCYKCYCKYQGG